MERTRSSAPNGPSMRSGLPPTFSGEQDHFLAGRWPEFPDRASPFPAGQSYPRCSPEQNSTAAMRAIRSSAELLSHCRAGALFACTIDEKIGRQESVKCESYNPVPDVCNARLTKDCPYLLSPPPPPPLSNSVVSQTIIKKSTGDISVMSFDSGEGTDGEDISF